MLAQAGALLTGEPMEETADGIAYLAKLGILAEPQAEELAATAAFLSNLHTAVRLLSDQPLDADTLAPAARSFLSDVLQTAPFDALVTKLTQSYQRGDRILTTVLAPYATGGEIT